MKTGIKKIIWVVFLLANYSHLARAGALDNQYRFKDRVEDIPFQVRALAREAAALLVQEPRVSLAGVDIALLKHAIATYSIVLTPEPLVLKGARYGAINDRVQRVVWINLDRWSTTRSYLHRRALVIHEFLSVINADDRNYRISGVFLTNYIGDPIPGEIPQLPGDASFLVEVDALPKSYGTWGGGSDRDSYIVNRIQATLDLAGRVKAHGSSHVMMVAAEKFALAAQTMPEPWRRQYLDALVPHFCGDKILCAIAMARNVMRPPGQSLPPKAEVDRLLGLLRNAPYPSVRKIIESIPVDFCTGSDRNYCTATIDPVMRTFGRQ